MSFLLKILEGPNKGAEIALPEGVAVTLGKGDDCDIVLADATLPDAPVSLAAAPDGVTLDGAPLEPLHVKTIGATSFAVGPDGAPWGELAWPEKESLKVEGSKVEGSSSEIVNGAPNLKPSTEGAASAPRRRSAGCLIPAAVILILLFLIAWFLLPRIRSGVSGTGDSLQSANLQPSNLQPSTLSSLADRFGLAVEESEAGATRVTGNFATRRERLAATAEFYAAQPGVDLDLSDDESLRTAAEDTLAMLSEADLRVAAATNRVLALSGTARDIRRTLEALAADLPKLRDVDVSSLKVEGLQVEGLVAPSSTLQPSNPKPFNLQPSTFQPSTPPLPVCGILTTPYPCLVLKNGARVLEGAPLGDGVVLKIEADSVTITNSAGRFTWKP